MERTEIIPHHDCGEVGCVGTPWRLSSVYFIKNCAAYCIYTSVKLLEERAGR